MRDTEDRDDELDYGLFSQQRRQQPERIGHRPEYNRKRRGRSGTAPTSYNGIHRRRKKRMMW